jgi:hypothetical protein
MPAIEVVQSLTADTNTQTVTGLKSGDVILWLMRYQGSARGTYSFAQSSQSSHLRLRVPGSEPEDPDVSYTVPAHPVQPLGYWKTLNIPFWYQERHHYATGEHFGTTGNITYSGGHATLWQDYQLFVYPITGIADGDYQLIFEMPTPTPTTSDPISPATMRVAWGKVLRNVDLAVLGRSSEYPNYSPVRPGRSTSPAYNDFPTLAAMPDGVTSAYLMCYLRGGGMAAPESGYGTLLFSGTQDGDINSLIYDQGIITGNYTYAAPPTGSYYPLDMDWFMLTSTPAVTAPTTYFMDAIVFNGTATSAPVEF